MVTFLLANMGSVIAANTSDTARSFVFGRTTFDRYTSSRSKQNASPLYFYVDNLTGGDAIKVRGVTGNKKVTSYSPFYFIGATGKYCISSNIYEDGYRSARIHGQKYSRFSTVSAGGDWSPDSWSCGW